MFPAHSAGTRVNRSFPLRAARSYIGTLPEIHRYPDPVTMARAAADFAAASLTRLLRQNETVRLLAATGASQITFLSELTSRRDIEWRRVELFHLDEYIGLGEDHPASFARYIRERIVEPTGITRYHLLDGTRQPEEMAAQVSEEIRRGPIQLAFAGIGENGHLAFNDPPADFETREAYAAVQLDERCRRQQLGEGWFPSLDDVPRSALSITVPELLRAQTIVCVIPDNRKAEAVRDALGGPLTPSVPASALQVHPSVHVFLDGDSASLLGNHS